MSGLQPKKRTKHNPFTKLFRDNEEVLSTSLVKINNRRSKISLKNDTGVLCFMFNRKIKAHFFEIFSLEEKRLVWDQEAHMFLSCRTTHNVLQLCEGKTFVLVDFIFYNEDEANCFHKAFLTKSRQELTFKTNNKNSKIKENGLSIGSPLNFQHVKHQQRMDDFIGQNEISRTPGVNVKYTKDTESMRGVIDFDQGREALVRKSRKMNRKPESATFDLKSENSISTKLQENLSIEEVTLRRKAPSPPETKMNFIEEVKTRHNFTEELKKKQSIKKSNTNSVRHSAVLLAPVKENALKSNVNQDNPSIQPRQSVKEKTKNGQPSDRVSIRKSNEVPPNRISQINIAPKKSLPPPPPPPPPPTPQSLPQPTINAEESVEMKIATKLETSDSRNALFDSIRQGVVLKSVKTTGIQKTDKKPLPKVDSKDSFMAALSLAIKKRHEVRKISDDEDENWSTDA